jgi:prepilin-type N-terminal cleavage/methylation domain-containing protein
MRRGFSLVECTLALVIVAGLTAATISGVGAVARTRQIAADRARGYGLAKSLLDEMLSRAFVRPAAPSSTTLGPDSGESQSDRRTLDDIDDYDGLSESPPVDMAGTPVAGFTGWRRVTEVKYVTPGDLTSTTASPTRRKRIVITVYNGSRQVAQVTYVRSRGIDDALIYPPNSVPYSNVTRTTEAP